MKVGVEVTRRGEAATAHPLDQCDPHLEALRELLHGPATSDLGGAALGASIQLLRALEYAVSALRRAEPVPPQEKP